jgi:hypothetical protein
MTLRAFTGGLPELGGAPDAIFSALGRACPPA